MFGGLEGRGPQARGEMGWGGEPILAGLHLCGGFGAHRDPLVPTRWGGALKRGAAMWGSCGGLGMAWHRGAGVPGGAR